MSGSHQHSPSAAALPGSASLQSSCQSTWQSHWSHSGACRVPISLNILACSYTTDGKLTLIRCHAGPGDESAMNCGKSLISSNGPFDVVLLPSAGTCECRELAQTQCLCKSGLPHRSCTMREEVQCAGRWHKRPRQSQRPGLLRRLLPQRHERKRCKHSVVSPCIVWCCQSCGYHASCYILSCAMNSRWRCW